MAGLIDLPLRLLDHIFSFLSVDDKVEICFTCTKIYEICQLHLISFWADQVKSLEEALQDVKIECKSVQSSPVADLRKSLGAEAVKYEAVLSKYGSLLGLWQRKMKPYGGLLQIKFTDGIILASLWQIPLILTDPLREKKIFSIELQEDGSFECYCQAQSKQKHHCQLGEIVGNSFSSKCTDPTLHIHPGGKQKEFADWFFEKANEEPNPENVCGQDLLVMEFVMLDHYKNSFAYKRIDYPNNLPEAVIQPGLFKGIYSCHGIELVMLSYEENGRKVKGTKITGDPNVPAFEASFQADLEPIVEFTAEEKQIYIDLELIPIPQEESLEILPQEASEDIDPDTNIPVPKIWKARFRGFGQISGYGFSDPSETPVHWIVYDENTFGLLWTELYLLIICLRVTEKLN